ncbi:50S ribosomal protein L6 [Patescibacteria group bacterium]|nr:50S ribosomal protein L6 [Patescibacteria group bacterium]
MSRLGKLPINLPSGVQVSLNDLEATFKGPKGELKLKLGHDIELTIAESEISILPKDKEAKNAKAFWGLYWSLARNCVIGVSEGFSKKLEINGVGYRAVVAGDKLNMNLGFSHPIVFEIPKGITATVEGNTITITGADKALVGETAANIRKLRKPEPYKGKGVKYSDEMIRRKAGKAAAKK